MCLRYRWRGFGTVVMLQMAKMKEIAWNEPKRKPSFLFSERVLQRALGLLVGFSWSLSVLILNFFWSDYFWFLLLLMSDPNIWIWTVWIAQKRAEKGRRVQDSRKRGLEGLDRSWSIHISNEYVFFLRDDTYEVWKLGDDSSIWKNQIEDFNLVISAWEFLLAGKLLFPK